MNFIGASILLVLVFVVLFASERKAALAMMAGVLYLTQSQAIEVFGFNLYAMRFLELAGFIRVVARGELSFLELNKVDYALVFVYSYSAIVYALRSSDGPAKEIASAIDAFLCYFTFRVLIRRIGDLCWFLRAFCILLAPYAVIVAIETLTKHNLFSFLGAGSLGGWQRGDRYRSLGTFRNPDLLGTLGASFLFLYIGLAFVRAHRKIASLGIALCLTIIYAANSGGPLAAAIVGFAGWACWPLRTEMRKVRWGIAGGLVLVAMVMKAPIWYLPSHISDFTGGSGWHRSYLMDVSFKHLGEWWACGMPITATADWFPYGALVSTGGADITNQYISFGINAGLGAMFLFIFLVAQAFKLLGKTLSSVRSGSTPPGQSEYVLWGLAVTLVVHTVNWLGITYFDQTYVIWFFQVASISSLASVSGAVECEEADGFPELSAGCEACVFGEGQHEETGKQFG